MAVNNPLPPYYWHIFDGFVYYFISWRSAQACRETFRALVAYLHFQEYPCQSPSFEGMLQKPLNTSSGIAFPLLILGEPVAYARSSLSNITVEERYGTNHTMSPALLRHHDAVLHPFISGNHAYGILHGLVQFFEFDVLCPLLILA
jgi:hypothetical protein